MEKCLLLFKDFLLRSRIHAVRSRYLSFCHLDWADEEGENTGCILFTNSVQVARLRYAPATSKRVCFFPSQKPTKEGKRNWNKLFFWSNRVEINLENSTACWFFRASILWNVTSVMVQPFCCLLKEYVTKKQRSCYSAMIVTDHVGRKSQLHWETLILMRQVG